MIVVEKSKEIMQPYQEEYIANLKDIAVLTARKKINNKSFEESLKDSLLTKEKVSRIINRNMELLRDKLFPQLDHLFEASEEELQELQEFAKNLLNDKDGLDAQLFCQVHQALLSRARQAKDRNSMIRELYWLGIGRFNLCNKMTGLELSQTEKYVSQMRLCFTEAAAYLKYYDEIEDTETRGYILRSRANMALGSFKTPSEKIRLGKLTLQILQDKDYQEKEPDLPWDHFIYMTHQQITSSMSHSRSNIMTSQDIADVMESVYIVYQKQLEEAENQNKKLPIRYAFSYYALEYYCGLDTLDGLLTKMEKLMDTADPDDFSPDSIYGLISLPAFYCQYLQEYPERIPKHQEYIEELYKKIRKYVSIFPDAFVNEKVFLSLRQLSSTFLETENSISYGEFLQRILIRFAPGIYVHSQVVGKAARILCEIIMNEEPTFFDDIDFIQEIKNPEEKKAKVLDYAMKCGIFHDVGKINFINFYSRIARQWFTEEYEIVRLHTTVGEMRMRERISTRHYAAIALGHHSWYDGSRGYPESYKRLESPYRQMVDVIGLINWMENVTYSSEFYTGVKKTFDEAVQDAIALEGKRFSPLLTARLRDKKITDQIYLAFTEGRKEIYRQLYDLECKENSKDTV